jgi:hypothetical protein
MSPWERAERERMVQLLDIWIAVLGAEIEREHERERQARCQAHPQLPPTRQTPPHPDWRSAA